MKRVLITGAAGLVGQNLVPVLKERGFEIVAIDKHPQNIAIFRELHPEVLTVEADLAETGEWETAIAGCDSAILLHAQIGGLVEDEFIRNNFVATERVLAALKNAGCEYIVHASSSVVNSAAVDFYTETKKTQEKLVEDAGIPTCILRPTLMFGWFDRKHLGWLKRFMEKAPVFPIPGHGRYLRQPLYGGDFAAIICSALSSRKTGTFDITGLERIDYVDLIRAVRTATSQKTPIIKIPYKLFWVLLRSYAIFDRNPPFTTNQLKALTTPDVFDVIDWPGIFDVEPTPLNEALHISYNDPRYAEITLAF